MLHATSINPNDSSSMRPSVLREQVLKELQYDELKLIDLLLNLAQLELNVRELYRQMVEKKQAEWHRLKTEAKERTVELSEVFSGDKALSRIAKNENMQKWFLLISTKIDALNYDLTTAAGSNSTTRDITQLVNALQEGN
jgi:WASH complex subunit strumpellin